MNPAGRTTAPLLSPHWFRVAALRPRLDPQVEVERISYRREIWYVLVRPDGSRSWRLNAAAYAFLGRCNGAASVQRLWDLLVGELRDDAPTQDELLQLMARLHAARLLTFDRRPDFGPPGTTPEPAHAAPAGARNSLLSFRIPLGHPDRWLDRLAPHVTPLFTPAALGVWLLGVLVGLAAALLNFDVLAAQARTGLATPRLLLMVWLAYPVVKALHELAHALALKRWGGAVPEWGVTVMMFTPVPYVDASAASALASPAQRVLVSAAGIMLELMLAALALAVALNAQPGALRDLAFAVFFIGTVSTLLVNGNPLLRFDGYHALTDALQLPNLATRSTRHWLAWLRRHVLRVPPAERGLEPAAGEAPWLWAYAPLALACRVAICAAVVVWLGRLSFLLGAAIALYFCWMLLLQPLLALLRFLGGAALAEADRGRARRAAAVAALALAVLIGAVPFPFASVVQGVVWLPDDARVRAETDGFVERIEVADGAWVRPGQILFSLRQASLEPERARLEGRITALETERYQALRSDPARAASVEHELDGVTAELERTDERLARLEVKALGPGQVVIDQIADLPGRYVKQGSLLAHVLGEQAPVVRVAIAQEQAALVRAQTRAVSVRLAASPQQAWRAELLGDAAGTVAKLPSAAFGDRGGGEVVTDPLDKTGLTPVYGVVVADVRLDVGDAAHRFDDDARTRVYTGAHPGVGAHAWVRFDHGHATLAVQAARRLQQLFLRHFNPAE